MIKYKIRGSDWLAFPLIIFDFNHFFIQPAPEHQSGFRPDRSKDTALNKSVMNWCIIDIWIKITLH